MKRIQRKRAKGWKMPDNTVYVGRPTEWGNPFKLDCFTDKSHIYGMAYYFCVNRTILSPWIIYDNGKNNYILKDLLYFYELWVTEKLTDDIGLPLVPNIEQLRGKDLACWCSLDQPCHADVLIKLLK